MEQLTQNLKNGDMQLMEAPFPSLREGWVLIRNHFSLVSAGTEGKTVSDARKGLIGKAIARKEEVEKVIRTAKTTGVMNTYRMVMDKLEIPMPLGYSSSGVVIAVGKGVQDLREGDQVACGGNTANHAEVIAVPRNLCALIPDALPVETAAMTTLGAIALQGIRQSELRLGEYAVVIGLGLIGQMTLQMLEAAGVRALGIDIDQRQVDMATVNGLNAINRHNEFLKEVILNATSCIGADAVIITAATSSDDPVNLAGELCRQKGKVIIVGSVPSGFKRQEYFKKELDLRMSCSYGPGRYDTRYEDQGIDYPSGYVRWTENRNMQAFLDLASSQKIHPEKLITHRFEFSDAPSAYQMILDRNETFGGIILKYDLVTEPKSKIFTENKSNVTTALVSGVIGAGSFAQNMLLPAISEQTRLRGVVTSKPHQAGHLQNKYQFEFTSGDAKDLMDDPQISNLFITTRHDSHAALVLESLRHGKHVYVEKPLCMNEEELELIRKTYEEHRSILMTGFNRRFSPLIVRLKKDLDVSPSLPRAVHYRVNAGALPANHWVHDSVTGGGRIIGEVCHFIDLCMFLAGAPITSVSASAMADAGHLNDTLTINLAFSNGSIAGISYFSNGSKQVPKEKIEVFYGGKTAEVNDFTSLTIHPNQSSKSVNMKLSTQDKGHRHSFAAFLDSVRSGQGAPIPFAEQYLSMLATFYVRESVMQNGERLLITSQ